ncbi:sodium/nucleoside cotransporter, putative [Pediculus humanus corporis]|uniref:Sodium/nucleoside cotransporter, putative n=1 Tax=Pediculus humanus subsp. corporis TaxID=121224 RepID=E0VFA2_PEDHC|nr:sodium/nucleoside cotransporter, putative [Pediculus humanus corporis]EEB12058.1 sodium/nucleoside cotransporter, putative [Pediculus humanus corporis]
MKGIVNSGFIAENEDHKVKVEEDSFELKDEVNGKDISSSLQNTESNNNYKNNNINNDDDNVNILAKIIIKTRTVIKKKFSGSNSSGTFSFWKIFSHGVFLAILAASIVKYFKSGVTNIDWCEGVGFLWILYFLTYCFLLYSIIKKYAGNKLETRFVKITGKILSLSNNKYVRGILYAIPIIALATYVALFPGKSGRRIFSFLGIVVFTLFGFIFSKYPGHIKWRTVIAGMALQFVFGLITINWEGGRKILECIGSKVTQFLLYSEQGALFVYGHLSQPHDNHGPIFAFSVLPVIFFLSFSINILNYYGILQWFIIKISTVVKVVMNTTACESVNAVASIFLGMTETPILIKSYIKDLTESEICAILCAGWSTVAGVVMAAYIKFGVKASHLISASFMSAPASLSFSKLFYPETNVSKTCLNKLVLEKEDASNGLDAATRGAISAISMVLGIVANIIAVLSFVAFIDGVLMWLGLVIGIEELSLKLILGKIFIPVSFLIGVDTESLEEVSYLIGIKTVANEFQAYLELSELIKQEKLSERSEILATYALCGFSNFGSIGISVGVFSAIEPSQSSAVTKVACRAFIAANIVCFLTACIAGCIIQ